MASRTKCRVLVVEDEPMIAMMFDEMIQDFGSEVIGPVSQIKEALRLASTAELDAAVLDINLGGAVVYPVADVLQERGIPFIFATGYRREALPARFAESTALPKPFTYATLADALEAALAGQPCHSEAA